jgi:hypothetical protein
MENLIHRDGSRLQIERAIKDKAHKEEQTWMVFEVDL